MNQLNQKPTLPNSQRTNCRKGNCPKFYFCIFFVAMCIGFLSIPAASANDVTGTWNTTLGQANLEQSGISVLGTLMNNGKPYLVKGSHTGNGLQMTLSVNGKVKFQIQNLQINQTQGTASGHYKSMVGSGLYSVFQMTLQGGQGGGQGGGNGNLTPAYNIAGSWSSSLGNLSLTQTGNIVRGELRFHNGVIAVLNGTIVNRDYNFQWGIEGQKLGTGSLHLSQNMKSMQGTYVDNRVGHPVSLKVSRILP